MARGINKLSAIEVSKKTKPGRYGDGGGLWLQVSKFGTKAWIFRYMIAGKARHMGLGDLNTFSLQEARERARKQRQLLVDGIDPLAAIETDRAERAKLITFNEAAVQYIAAHRAGWKNVKHADQWRATLETYAGPIVGNMSVADIETPHILKVLAPIWTDKTETATRLRGRMEAILAWATVRQFRSGDNPARWRGHLDKLLAKPTKIAKVRHHPAMPYTAVPSFMEHVRGMDSISARALEWTILTAARTGEAIGTRWEEIDLATKVWTVAGDRMKAGREHRVPLSERTVSILASLPREGEFVFPGAGKGRPLSNMAMLQLLRGIDPSLTVHGFRSSFRDWAAERTNYPRDIAEQALAHTIKNATEAAYRRGDALEKRRRLMQAWASYCEQKPSAATVMPIREATNG